jgi:methionyl-tRNA formyltransferase
MKNKLVFLGSKPIGFFCLHHLLKNQDHYNIEVVAVLTNNTNRLGKADLGVLASEYNIPVFDSLGELSAVECDFMLSVQYHQILKKRHLDVAQKMAINLHMAPLPEYRGCNQFTFAIIDGKKEFGTTLHIMNEGIDSGDILAEKRFPIPENCFVKDLYELTLEASCQMFEQKIGAILLEKINPISQEELMDVRTCSIHYRKEITEAKKIDLNWTQDKIWKHVRATSMPGFPPPYAEINGIKLNLSIENK